MYPDQGPEHFFKIYSFFLTHEFVLLKLGDMVNHSEMLIFFVLIYY